MTPDSTKAAPGKQRGASSWTDSIIRWAGTPLSAGIPPAKWLHTLLRVVLITLREMEINQLTLRSGALTYAMLLSMVPMLAMSTAVVKGLGGGDQLREVVYRYIDTLEMSGAQLNADLANNGPELSPDTAPEPDQASKSNLTNHLRSVVDKIFAYVDRTNFATLGTFGMLGIFLSVILVLGQIETAMNTIWRVVDARSILRKITDYLTLMVLLPISINVALAAGAILENDALVKTIQRVIPAAWLQTLLLQGVPILFLSITIYILYIFFPNTKIKKVPTMIGASLAGFLWFAIQNIYISMQVGVAKYNAIYGSFASVPLFLAWVYLGWLFVLFGAQVAFAIQNKSSYQLIAKPAVPALQLSGALDLCHLVRSRFSEHQGTSLADIHAAYPFYETDMLEKIRDMLVAANILHHSEESGEIMPSLPPERLTNHRIIETILVSEPPSTDGGRTAAQVVEATLQAMRPRQDESTAPVPEEEEEPAQQQAEPKNGESSAA